MNDFAVTHTVTRPTARLQPWRFVALALFGLAAWHTPAGAVEKKPAPQKVEISLWLRKPGTELGEKARGKLVSLDIASLKQEELETFDIQYDQKGRYRGRHLRDIIPVLKPLPLSADVLLLHTRAGMIVPVAYEDLRKNREIFIAMKMYAGGAWTTDLRATLPKDTVTEAPLPIKFEGNKIVAGTEWRQKKGDFTPWAYVDSLAAVEFVESDAYFKQFAGTSKKTSDIGRVLYASRCHFCHAVHGLGGKVGPDLASFGSLPVKDLQDRIYNQVIKPKDTHWSRAHSMPGQKDFKPADAEALAKWIRARKADQLAPYEPAYAKEVTWD